MNITHRCNDGGLERGLGIVSFTDDEEPICNLEKEDVRGRRSVRLVKREAADPNCRSYSFWNTHFYDANVIGRTQNDTT